MAIVWLHYSCAVKHLVILPDTLMLIWGLKFHPTVKRNPESNPKPLVYKAKGFPTTSCRLFKLKSFNFEQNEITQVNQEILTK